jgi:hypothetical protein
MTSLPSYHVETHFEDFFEVKLSAHLKEGFERFKRIICNQTDEGDLDDPLIQLTLLHYYFGSHAAHELQ